MKLFNSIAIVGVGLIGGSIGLAIKKRGLAGQVTGVFRRKSTLRKALRYRAVTKGTLSVKAGVEGADLIILAMPVRSIPSMAREAAKYAKKDAILTDVGSTKKWLVERIENSPGVSSKVMFVGSHPMAGSERSGVQHADERLFAGSPCIVTKTKRTDRAALSKTVNFWKSLGAHVSVMTPDEHDRSVSMVSHLPHMVSFSLMSAVPERDFIYAAEGLKDTTRLASSDPEIWADIFLTNKDELIRSVKAFSAEYKKLARALKNKDYRLMIKLLSEARAKRVKLTHGA